MTEKIIQAEFKNRDEELKKDMEENVSLVLEDIKQGNIIGIYIIAKMANGIENSTSFGFGSIAERIGFLEFEKHNLLMSSFQPC